MKLPAVPPDTKQVLAGVRPERLHGVLLQGSPSLPDGRYLHWDDLRRRTPPCDLSAEEWWAATRLARQRLAQPVAAMARTYGSEFFVVPTAEVQRAVHEFDRTNVGRVLLEALGDDDALAEYRVRQLIEEAISSSAIEGARPTTREVARHMVRENRAPTSRDEQMILNNWRAMRRVIELRDKANLLTLDDLLELHRILGEGALDVDGAEGKLRTRRDRVVISDVEGNVWREPPDANGIEQRLEALLCFANGQDDRDGAFVHPVVRAIIAHFWLGYEHPFRDGNGRMARALYYWCMLRHGYEMAEFLSISGPIDRSLRGYYLAFAHSETDPGDLTYFVLHQLGVMRAALDELVAHLQERARRTQRLVLTVAKFSELNHRQRALLQHAVKHPLESYTIEGHATSHQVHYQTARNDLIDLLRRGLLGERRVGKGKRYFPTRAIGEKLGAG